MKYLHPKFHWGMMLLIIAILLQVSCISENNDLEKPSILSLELEKNSSEPFEDPIYNLRMDPTSLKMLADLRAATAKYHDVTVAEAAGYLPISPCVSYPGLGAMGFHYGNFDIVDGTYDPTQPEVLLYEMDKNGNLKLVGVEFIIRKGPWDSEHDIIPSFGTREFDIALAPVPLPFDNYQLHVWIWKHNPNGIFTMFNPNVTCL
jgi:hypothetical protein